MSPRKLAQYSPLPGGCLKSNWLSWLALALCIGLAAQAQTTEKVALDTSETLFAVFTAINACGYDNELGVSLPVRTQVRQDVTKALHSSAPAQAALEPLCAFYRDHNPGDSSQYVSLALDLTNPPTFATKVKEADLPPDASYVVGFVPLLQAFYDKAGLHAIWLHQKDEYAALVERYHDPVSKMLLSTDLYLKLPLSGYLGRQFTVYLEPMGAPGQVNARNYGNDYFVVVSPGTGSSLKMDEIRHTYLHYVLDPMALKRANTMARLSVLLPAVKNAPLDENFKNDISLLLTESLVRAIEARRINSGKAAEAQQLQAVDDDMKQGFVLTRYFYDQLGQFEKSSVGLRDAYPDWLYYLNVDKEKKRASEIQFAAKAAPEVVRASKAGQPQLLVAAEKQLEAGDLQKAQKLAQQALDEKQGDPGRAFFILARAATMNRDMAGARNYFERTLQVAHEPSVVAWSHVYLGRIFDLQENRDAAVDHYRAAMGVADATPEVKAAAQRGLQSPYEPPARSPSPEN